MWPNKSNLVSEQMQVQPKWCISQEAENHGFIQAIL